MADTNNTPPFKSLAIPILFLALSLFVFSGWSYFKTKDFIAKSVSVNAEIIELIESHSSEGNATYAPRVRFSDVTGLTIEVTSSISRPAHKYELAETIEILYDPNNPEEFKTTEWFSLWLFAIFGALAGGFFIILAFLVAFVGPLIYNKLKPEKNGEQGAVANPRRRLLPQLFKNYNP